MEKENQIHGVKTGKDCETITHLMFDDDLIIFANANDREANSIIEVLKQYEEWFGQEVNFLKSAILFSKNVEGNQAILYMRRRGT